MFGPKKCNNRCSQLIYWWMSAQNDNRLWGTRTMMTRPNRVIHTPFSKYQAMADIKSFCCTTNTLIERERCDFDCTHRKNNNSFVAIGLGLYCGWQGSIHRQGLQASKTTKSWKLDYKTNKKKKTQLCDNKHIYSSRQLLNFCPNDGSSWPSSAVCQTHSCSSEQLLNCPQSVILMTQLFNCPQQVFRCDSFLISPTRNSSQ